MNLKVTLVNFYLFFFRKTVGGYPTIGTPYLLFRGQEVKVNYKG